MRSTPRHERRRQVDRPARDDAKSHRQSHRRNPPRARKVPGRGFGCTVLRTGSGQQPDRPRAAGKNSRGQIRANKTQRGQHRGRSDRNQEHTGANTMHDQAKRANRPKTRPEFHVDEPWRLPSEITSSLETEVSTRRKAADRRDRGEILPEDWKRWAKMNDGEMLADMEDLELPGLDAAKKDTKHATPPSTASPEQGDYKARELGVLPRRTRRTLARKGQEMDSAAVKRPPGAPTPRQRDAGNRQKRRRRGSTGRRTAGRGHEAPKPDTHRPHALNQANKLTTIPTPHNGVFCTENT